MDVRMTNTENFSSFLQNDSNRMRDQLVSQRNRIREQKISLDALVARLASLEVEVGNLRAQVQGEEFRRSRSASPVAQAEVIDLTRDSPEPQHLVEFDGRLVPVEVRGDVIEVRDFAAEEEEQAREEGDRSEAAQIARLHADPVPPYEPSPDYE
jgi:hypothetical protein